MGCQRFFCQLWKMFLGSTLARLLGSSTMLTGTLSGGDGDDEDDYGDVDDVYITCSGAWGRDWVSRMIFRWVWMRGARLGSKRDSMSGEGFGWEYLWVGEDWWICTGVVYDRGGLDWVKTLWLCSIWNWEIGTRKHTGMELMIYKPRSWTCVWVIGSIN